MKAQELDPFAIKSYTFALGKTNNFFSFTTVILSLCVIGLSFGISYSTISHLWLPLRDLPTTIANTQQYPGPLSSTLVCFNLTTFNGTTPTYRVWDSNYEYLNLPYVNQETAFKKYPNLTNMLGSKFGCIDLAGVTFTNQINAIFVEVQVDPFEYCLEYATAQKIRNQQPNYFIKAKNPARIPTGTVNLYNYYSSAVRVNGLNANIYNSLMANDEGTHPKYVANIDNWRTYSTLMTQTKIFPTYPTFCILSTAVDLATLTNVTITRYDIGYIIGAVLSWISIFGLICGFIVAPLMERSLNLIQAETLFYLPQEDRKPSVFKFIVASFKKGIFPKEDKYCKLVDELQKLKNVSCSLKVQKTLRRLCPRSSKLTQNQVIAAEHNFDEPQNDEFGIQTYSEGGKYSAADFNIEQDEKKENILTKARKGVFHWLDMGSDEVSINYSGRGHGSKQSVCVSLVFIVGFIAFLALFGVLKYSKQEVVYTQRSSDDVTQRFVAGQVLFANLGEQINLYLVDGYGNRIRQLITSNSNCLTYANSNVQRQMKEITDDNYLGQSTVFACSAQDYDLVASSNPSVVRQLNLQLIQASNINVFHMQIDSQSKLADQFLLFRGGNWASGYYYQAKFKIYNIVQDGNNTFTGTQLTLYKKRTDFSLKKTYFLMVLDPDQTYKQITNTDFFTIIQNIWGLSTIAITLILMKLTKYINLRQKQKVITPQKSEFRDNLCIFLSKINGLLAGRHKGELQKAKYYLKEQMPRPRH